jgi:hypothetical protein
VRLVQEHRREGSLLNEAEFEVLENQANLIQCQRMCAGRGGVGSGKTYAAIWKAWQFSETYPKAGIYVTGADFEQLRGGYFLDFQEFLTETLHWKEGEDFIYRAMPRPTLLLKRSGARIRSLSSEIAERIRSTRIHFIHCEEPTTWHNGEAVYHRLIGRMRHTVLTAKHYPDMKFQGVLTFNPPPIGSWLYNVCEVLWKKDEEPCICGVFEGKLCPRSWRFSLRDNHLLPGLSDYIKLQEMNLPPHQWPVEIDGHYGTVGGEVYRSFDGSRHLRVDPVMYPLQLDPAKPLMWTLDFNVHYMCSIVAQQHWQPSIDVPQFDKNLPFPTKRLPWPEWQERILYALDEITLVDAGAEDCAEEFIRRYGPHARKQGVYIYGDPAGGARSQVMSSSSANRTPWEVIINKLRAAGIPILGFRVPNQAPTIIDRVNYTNAQFKSGEGWGAAIHPKCEVLRKDFLEVHYKPGTNEIEKKNEPLEAARLTHASDAWGYLVWVERMLAKPGKKIEWKMVR